jgi:hypothetical protein
MIKMLLCNIVITFSKKIFRTKKVDLFRKTKVLL